MATQSSYQLPVKTTQRRDLPLTILAWIGVIAVLFFIIQKIWHSLIILIFGCVLAYMLFPVMKFLQRYMNRIWAILIIYVVLICAFGTFIYFSLQIAISQITALIPTIHKIFFYTSPQQVPPIFLFLNSFGLSQESVLAAGRELTKYLEQFATNILPLIGHILDSVLSTTIVIVISIYLLTDGERIANWLNDASNIPLSHRGKVQFFLQTLHRVVGAYIRGQLLLSMIIGVLVGVGMAIFHVPYAILLGLVAFIMEFVPILGTFISGTACVLLALTQGWLIALLVLLYFIGLHIIEADIVGPRIVGRALGIHPLVSLLAILVASDLFGFYGVLFGAPAIGLLQAIFTTIWKDWKKLHQEEFR
ncbi:MAG TPA: AI-2E family transporter [Candidatus Saccharimonadales bacterium]|nr:AI-2E family transporter [Candidatus Saccharimonadales bacterium]